MKLNLGYFVVFFMILYTTAIHSQQLGTLSLSDLSNFKPQDGNWQIVGDVIMDRNINVHENGNGSLKTTAGIGTLINLNSETQKSALLTTWVHGDMEMELEFMMPKGSNSGIYLQGRYEVQLFDSWGVKYPKFSDLGGIYRNWESEKGKIYMGKAPLANSAKAPGLWQKMYISFLAPRFDASGKKTSNAKLKLVKINGVTIHENLEIPLPTGGPIVNDEVAKGPLMIQGDHGGVAFKNIKYRLLENEKIFVDNVSYKYWKGPYEYEKNYKDKIPDKTGKSPEGLTWEMSEVPDFFALELTSDLHIPLDDKYYFSTISNAGMALYIDGVNVRKMIKAWDWDRPENAVVDLKSGLHKFVVYFNRADAWTPAALAIYASSDKIAATPLHNFSSFKERVAVYPTYVSADAKPTILRAFLDFEGDPKMRRTHTIGVGDPSRLHYVFDNANGAISCIWRGEFVDASPMWHDRGDGSFKPIGDPIFLSAGPQLDRLISADAAFPKTFEEGDFRPKGYKINESSETPIFLYNVKGINVTDQSYADLISNSITRELKFEGDLTNAKYLVASGKEILKLEDGSFLVDKKYYVNVNTIDNLYTRASNGKTELLIDLKSPSFRYTLTW